MDLSAFPQSVRADIAERIALIERAKATGQRVLHRPYCNCWSSWVDGHRDHGCIDLTVDCGESR